MQIDSTPEMVANTYATMRKNIEIMRARIGRPLTLADKILFGHLVDAGKQRIAQGKGLLRLQPDRVALQDVLGQTVLLNFMQTQRERVALPTTVHCDHLVQARVEGEFDLLTSIEENKEVYGFLKDASAKFGVGFWGPGSGIIHQVVLENYAYPGALILGTDSHTPNAGGLGACAVGVGGAAAVEVMAGLPWETLFPDYIGVRLVGEMSGWTAPKDVILRVAGELTVSGGTNAIIEYFGPGASAISCTGKATIANMGAEIGATTSIFAHDHRMTRYLDSAGRGDVGRLAEANADILTPDAEVEANPERFYKRVIDIDLSTLEPHVVGPHSPDRARPISELAAEVRNEDNGFIDDISVALIGSCTNSSYEDMSRAADVADQARAQGLNASIDFMITPGSEQVRATIERDGQMGALKSIDGVVLANACGPCIGQWQREKTLEGTPNTIVTSYNRNFPRRNDGRSETMNFIASPEIVTAFAIAGSLSFNPLADELLGQDGQAFRLRPPMAAPEVPPKGFDRGNPAYTPPPDDTSAIEITIDPHSERIEILRPWEPWDGRDYLDLPVLLKAAGKTTTDHISPAGPWLRYRGHLSKFSENMFMGASNAHTGEVGKGKNVLTGDAGRAFSSIAARYRDAGLRWVVVGDDNYGEGSSREHAALSPRLLGCAAVIARSFARIHESNLKKQGLLPLAFERAEQYDLIQEDDRVSLVGLDSLAEGRPVECVIRHADGSEDRLQLRHSFAESQIEWFRAGSALNVLHKGA